MIKCIIALTSFTKSRMKLLPKYLYESLFKYGKTEYKVVLTLYKDDIKDISEELQLMIDNGMIELSKSEDRIIYDSCFDSLELRTDHLPKSTAKKLEENEAEKQSH